MQTKATIIKELIKTAKINDIQVFSFTHCHHVGWYTDLVPEGGLFSQAANFFFKSIMYRIHYINTDTELRF